MAIDYAESPAARRQFESCLEHGQPRRANYATNQKVSAIRIGPSFLCRARILQITANSFKNIALIRFNLVSYNQKKFDTALSFLIPSDPVNLTNCSPRKRFRSTFFRFRCTAVLAAGHIVLAGACNIPMHFTGRLPSGSRPKDRIK
ncbi:hypothetical protein [Burkholderia metallica]|uniref:hypothetical protein n=1 Tax=Burkholderia metallica TaxID=488729 RepID=UPI0018FE6D15|nr:hypothetical protein [Burkholderia metallica]